MNDYGLFRYPDYTLPLSVKMAEVTRDAGLDVLHVHYAVPHATAAVLARSMLHEERRPAVEQLQTQMTLAPATRERLRAHLDSRRLITTRLEIREPEYIWVAVTARVRANLKAEPDRVRHDVRAALYRFLHPLDGGVDGQGWPFGQPLTIDKVYALIQSVRGVEYATELKLFPIDMEHGQLLLVNQEVIQIPANGVVTSYYHAVRVD